MVDVRETREGWPLLTVEIEVNGDSKSTKERGPALVGAVGLSCRYKRCSLCLGQAAVLGRLSLSMCLYLTYTSKIFDSCIPKKT